MIWYMPLEGDDRCKHQGTIRRSMIETPCGLSFPTNRAARLGGQPGDGICQVCEAGRTRHINDVDPDYPAVLAVAVHRIRDD